MHMHHSRTVKVKKSELIDILKKNKENHIKEFNDAVKAYKVEAKKELRELNKRLRKGDMKLGLTLITPVNKADEYDKVVKMFEMEVEDVVELTQGEFNEYVHDEMDFARSAKLSNRSYLGK